MKIKLTVIIPVHNQDKLITRALDSIPPRDDIEIICIDDGSYDDTWNTLVDYTHHSPKNIVLLYNDGNKGVAYSVNRGLDNANGEYIVLLGSDDYFLSSLNSAIDSLDGTDLIYFDLRVNSGEKWKLTPESKGGLCGSTKFMRKDFIGSSRNPLLKAGEDWYFYRQLLEKNPTEKFLGYAVKHYNYPRENSLTDLNKKGLL